MKSKSKKGPYKQFCVNGHEISICGRFKNGHCKGCAKEYHQRNKEKISGYNKKWQKEHREEIRESRKEYLIQYCQEHKEEIKQKRDENKEYKVAYDAIYYEEHKEDKKKATKKYRQDHPEFERLHSLRRNKKRSKRIVTWGQEGILEFYINCPKELEVDHYIPLCGRKISGLHVNWNLQYLIPEENNKKNNKCDLLELSTWYGKILEEAGLKLK